MAMSAQHKSQAQAMGLTEAQMQQMDALGIDWAKLFAALPQIIALVLSLFKTPAPGPTPVQ